MRWMGLSWSVIATKGCGSILVHGVLTVLVSAFKRILLLLDNDWL